jgi:hypothetical protein
VVAPPDDPAAIARALESLYDDWKTGRKRERDVATILEYEAVHQSREWAGLLDELASANAPPAGDDP